MSKLRTSVAEARVTVEMDQFDWREIRCGSEAAAKSEASRQQATEDPDEVEWIYLRNDAGHWVARRTPRHLKLTSARMRNGKQRRSREEGNWLIAAVAAFFDSWG